VSANNTANIATATRLAEPRSARIRFGRRDCLRGDGDTRQQRRSCRNRGDNQLPVPPQLHGRPIRRNTLRCSGSRTVVTPCRKPGGLTCGVDAPHLHRHRGEARHAEDEHDDQRGDRECRLDSDAAGVIGYTLVFSARLMMLVSALTMESPVITVYKMAPNAAAAMVPIAYSTV
jgi:hypothetical protein